MAISVSFKSLITEHRIASPCTQVYVPDSNFTDVPEAISIDRNNFNLPSTTVIERCRFEGISQRALYAEATTDTSATEATFVVAHNVFALNVQVRGARPSFTAGRLPQKHEPFSAQNSRTAIPPPLPRTRPPAPRTTSSTLLTAGPSRPATALSSATTR